ncbi:MAG: ankyrin repeat domain-containing protein [Cyanobacteria bacterium SID2]|nr:ankyrin repeat domain-containing protein [Cyanobacteria bacterium SID2]
MSTDRDLQQLFTAIERSDVERARQLLDAGVDPNSQNQEKTALSLASELGNSEIIQLLIAAGAEIDPQPKPLVFNPQLTDSELPGGQSFGKLIENATQDLPEEARNFYKGLTEIFNAFSSVELEQSVDRTENTSNSERSTTILEGQQGTYSGDALDALPENELAEVLELDRTLKSIGFQLLGQLTGTHFAGTTLYTYSFETRTIQANCMKSSIVAVDLVTRFEDGAFLTSTTTPLSQPDYDDKLLFRRSYPNIDIRELLSHHLATLAEFEKHHGSAQPIFSDLRSIAAAIDEYLQRQASDSSHAAKLLENALGILSQSSSVEENFEDEGEEDENFDEDGDEEDEYEASTPLLAAVLANRVEAVRTLLESGATPNAAAWYETPPLVAAAAKGYVEVARELLSAGADPNRGLDELPLHTAAENGHLEVVRLLLEAGANVEGYEEDDWTALMAASFAGHLEIVQLLVKNGADVNAWSQGATPLMLAARGAHREVYDFLYPLVSDEIRRIGDRDAEKEIEATLKRKAREQNKAGEALFDAAMDGRVDRVRQLLDRGVDPNTLAACGRTPLSIAIQSGQIPTIEALLDAGADPNLPDEDDYGNPTETPLMLASNTFFATNHREMIQLLVRRGADIDRQDRTGRTALMSALSRPDSVKTLIELGADLNLRDSKGKTALMLAERERAQKSARVLRQAGALES